MVDVEGDCEMGGTALLVVLPDGAVVLLSDVERRITGALRSDSRGSDKSMVVQLLNKVVAHRTNPLQYPRLYKRSIKLEAPYTSKSGLYQFAMPLNTHQRTHTQTKGDKGRAAIAHEGQWHTDDRQNSADHTHIHKHINKYRQG